jgi:hypothetical protein
MRRRFHAFAAVYTSGGTIKKLRFKQPRFRIRAPKTPQGTTFKKNKGSDTRPVMDAVTLDVKNHTPDISVI